MYKFISGKSQCISHNDAHNNITQWIQLLHEHNIILDIPTDTVHIDEQQTVISNLQHIFHTHDIPCFLPSMQFLHNTVCMLIYVHGLTDRYFVIMGNNNTTIQALGFHGEIIPYHNTLIQCNELNHAHADLLRKYFPHTAPSPILSQQKKMISMGLGDRLGIASMGHLALLDGLKKATDKSAQCHIAPILAQQSKRELQLTGRTYADIIDCASWDVFGYNYTEPWGADGDHLKTVDEIQQALDMGCSMITADLSNAINDDFVHTDTAELEKAFHTLNATYCTHVETYFFNQHKIVNNIEIAFSKEEAMRLALIYHAAILLAKDMHSVIKDYESTHDGTIDFEISIDEISIPTTPQAHYFISTQLQKYGVSFHSIAPKFCGEFQKGIDYIGNIDDFKKELIIHEEIATHFGYKISVHSGSDKFSVFPAIHDILQDNFHIKTSGTNWLVALHSIAKISPSLFRTLHKKSYEVFEVASQYYHITPNFADKVNIGEIADAQLETVLENICDRQVLHISYGEILKNTALKHDIYMLLSTHLEEYWKELNTHIGKHIKLLLGI